MSGLTGGWSRFGAVAALAGVAAAGVPPAPAKAQTAADIARLDALSRERGEAVRKVGPDGQPRQVQPPRAVAEPVRQLRSLWVCSGAAEGQPVYTAPDPGAPTMGRTLPWVATTGDAVDGFVEVLHTNGHRGWVPAAVLRPFQAENGSAAQCTVRGVRPNGAPAFEIR